MKLDRNINGNGLGKYTLIKWRSYDPKAECSAAIDAALRTLDEAGMLDIGNTPETEFFVIRLKDKYAGGALHTYASYAVADGEVEYGQDVMAMAKRSGEWHPNCKKPD